MKISKKTDHRRRYNQQNDQEKTFKKELNLPIKPMKLKSSKTGKIALSELKSGKIPTTEINDAIVAYVDVLGFSEKTNEIDIDNTLLDFSGALILASHQFPNIRFNVFSDNAFLATNKDRTEELVGAIRFVFARWCSNGILVRGGLALGTYKEFSSVAIKSNSKNFTGNLFSGTAITKAVRLEKGEGGAMIYTDKECSDFLAQKFKEPMFIVKDSIAIGWNDDDVVLGKFIAISLFRLLRILEINDKKYKKVQQKLYFNLSYAQNQIKTDGWFKLVLLSTIKYSEVSVKSKQKACKLLLLNYFEDFKQWDKWIKKFLTTNNQEWMILKGIADADSSIS